MVVSRREFLTKAGLGIGVVAVGGLVAACGSDDGDGNGANAGNEPGGTTTSTVLERINLTSAGSSAGVGAFLTNELATVSAARDVVIEVKVMTPTDSELAVVNGQIDMGLFGLLSCARSHIAGHGLVMFEPVLGSHSSLMSGKDNKATKLADLKGARIGIQPRVTAQYTDLLQLAAAQGLDLEKDFKLTQGDQQLLEALYKRGEVDAFCLTEPATTRLINAGEAREVFQFSQEWERQFKAPLVSLGWAVRKEWATENAAAIKRLRDANEEMVKKLSAGTAPYTAQKAAFGITDDAGITLLANRMKPILISGWTDEAIKNLKTRFDNAFDLKLLEKKVAVEDVIVK
jgi:ABC-type nitrate/sulfonate/bicarbonate transport system substrate-binding protein